MSALAKGAQAPAFSLADSEGNTHSLDELLRGGPLLLGFFKVGCPICQYAAPFWSRLAATSANFRVVSQDDPRATAEFEQRYGGKLPALFDSGEEGYPVSSAYGLTNVPTIFLIEPSGEIARSAAGWDKQALEQACQRLGVPAPFEPGEEVFDYRPG